MNSNRYLALLLIFFIAFSIFSVLGRGRLTYAQIPPATLTGVISDRGVDTDGNGFNYLEVGVEVSVNEGGLYEVRVSGLRDSSLNYSNYISVYANEVLTLSIGLHTVNVRLYGPTIYSSRKNPINVSYIALYKISQPYFPWTGASSWQHLGNIYDTPLSRLYSYDEFDAFFADMEAKFTVYPDGRVIMGGALNYTHMTPQNDAGFNMLADASFTRTNGATNMLADFAFIVQPHLADTFPFNSSSFNLLATYSSDIADFSLDGSVTLPSSLASQYPLNVSDFTIVADYLNGEMTGTITAPLISGMPLASIDVDFNGNLTDLYLSDELEVVYGTFFGQEINRTYVENLLLHFNSTIPGPHNDTGSLYNMTQGILECTRLDTTLTNITGGATITFDAHIHGDFIEALLFFLGGQVMDPTLDWLANTIISSIQTGHFEFAYAHGLGQASMQLAFTVNITKLWLDIESTLPPGIPPQQRTPIELLLNTTLCSVDSANVSWNYNNGRSDLHIDAVIGPDFNAELNFIKNVMITYGMPQPPPWQWQILNTTDIDLSNLSFTFNLTETTMLCEIDGFEVTPPMDPAGSDPSHFKLEQFFNLVYSPSGEPPYRDQRLKVTIEGGYNSTHIVTLLRSPTVPKPDIALNDQTSMTWLNQSVSGLKDLIFDVRYYGVFEWDETTYRVIFDSNSTVTNFNFNREGKFFEFDVSGPLGTFGFCNISIPRALLYAPPQEWQIIINQTLLSQGEYNVTETATHTFIYFTYGHSSDTIRISGTVVISEFDVAVLLPFLLIFTLILAVVTRITRKRRMDGLQVNLSIRKWGFRWL